MSEDGLLKSVAHLNGDVLNAVQQLLYLMIPVTALLVRLH